MDVPVPRYAGVAAMVGIEGKDSIVFKSGRILWNVISVRFIAIYQRRKAVA